MEEFIANISKTNKKEIKTATIKPCPFCGSPDYLENEYLDDIDTKGWYVQCSACEVRLQGFPNDTQDKVIYKWNNRAVDKQ